jgi:hypothetical protein
MKGTGAALLVFAFAPVYRAVDIGGEAPFRQASISVAEVTLQLAWWGSLVALLVAILLARLFPDVPRSLGRRVSDLLARPRLPWFAAGTGLLALVLALGIWVLLYEGLYTYVDEMASVIHARFLARGLLAGPLPDLTEGWLVPNMLVVGEGWVSQYPPSHLLVMAAFVRLGAPGLIGPVMLGAMVGLVALSLPRLVPAHPRAMRVATVLTALSPFLLFLAGGALSHLTAGAALVAVLYAALRARDGLAAWGLAVGAAVGLAVTARPLVGLLLGTLFPVALWWPAVRNGALRWGLRRVGATLVGGIPFAVGLGWYHTRLFGSPTRWGYLAAFGDGHGLGFHRDPWGYEYGPIDALGFTSTDLLSLGVQLLETSPPITAAIGAYLLLGRRIPSGAGMLIVWALLPVLGNAFYWFHSSRMLFEAAPAWIALGVLAVGEGVKPVEEGRGGAWRGYAGSVVAWVAVLALMGSVLRDVPARWRTNGWTPETLEAITVPDVPDPEPALVFVHTSWNERLSATLQGSGAMRQDSVTFALRRNATCDLHRYAVLRERQVRGELQGGALPTLDFSTTADDGTNLVRRQLEGGGTVRMREGDTLDEACLREMRADRFGTVALAPLVWQGDLPGDERGASMFVRDLGPEKNERIRAAFPDRTGYVLVPLAPEGPPRVVAYDEAMRVLWGK